jgi:LacI family transcriptional regulator
VRVTVSVREVAEAAGVSVGTVSNVLNRPDRVAPATAARVRAVIEKLGYVRNDAARQLRAGQSRAIGLVVLELSNPFFTDLARGAEERADESNLIVLLANSDDDAARERASLDLFEQQRVLGVVISPITDDLDAIRRLQARGIHVVVVERTTTDRSVSSVAVDNVAGGRLAVEHLAEVGRRRIAFVGGPSSVHQVADRLVGATRALANVAGMTLEVIDTPGLTVLDGRGAGEAIVARDPADRPEAVFAANDLLAIGVLQALRSGGVAVPADIALIGYDDIDFASSTEVPLSSIRQPSRKLAYTAVDLLLERVNDPQSDVQHIVFQPDLVVRSSTTGAPTN